MRSHITLVPTGGLCNRMISIMNAIDVCKDHDICIDIKWWKNNELFADFEELFLPIKDNKITISKLTQFKHLPSLKRNFFLPTLLRQFVSDRHIHHPTSPTTLPLSKSSETIQTFTFLHLHVSPYAPLRETLHPYSAPQRRLKTISAKSHSNTTNTP